MGDPFGSTKDGNTKKEEVSSVADDEVRQTSPAHVSIDIPGGSERARWRVLHRVPPQVRENKKHIYDPVVVSLGPYHHGHPQFRRAEELKDDVLNIICGAKDKGFLRSKIMERVDEIRHFYGGLSKDEYDDEALAQMMLRDACFVLYYMEMLADNDDEKESQILHRLGASGLAFIYRDIDMLDNQIPLWVVKQLITLTFDDDDKDAAGDALLCNFLREVCTTDDKLTRVPWKNEEQEPLHLLEASIMTLVKENESSTVEPIKSHGHRIFKSSWRGRESSTSSTFDIGNCPSLSVTDLKAKGIHFGPSSCCLKDIRFTSYSFYGKLRLPIWYVTNNSKVFFSNVIAFEMSPETDKDFAVTSYIDFMKSLIESPKDVKELREKGILLSLLANDEEVVRMFKEIDTYAFYDEGMFLEIKKRIYKHCNSKAKTWMAELAHTYFRSPWTAIALFAATFLLCLTFLQTYYTMNPRN